LTFEGFCCKILSTAKDKKTKRKVDKMKAYTIYYEDEYRMGIETYYYGQLTKIKKEFKDEGKEISQIDYSINGITIKTEYFENGKKINTEIF
jgi:hypothetical protein